MAERRFYLCNGKVVEYKDLYLHQAHILGHLTYLTDEGRRVTALARWEASVACDQVPPIAPEVDVYIIGDARRIKCRHVGCQNNQRWEIGRGGILALMGRLGLTDEFLALEGAEVNREPI